MGADKPDPRSDDAAKQARMKERFDAIISKGLDEKDKQALKALASESGEPVETAFPTPEVTEAPKKFSTLSETQKLHWLMKFMSSAAEDDYKRIRKEGKEDLDELGSQIQAYSFDRLDRTNTREELLNKFLVLSNPKQTIADIYMKVRVEITRLEGIGTPEAIQLRAKHILLRDFLDSYLDPTKLDNYFKIHRSFQKFIEENL